MTKKKDVQADRQKYVSDSERWDNDPRVFDKDPKYKYMVMAIVYADMRKAGVDPNGIEAMSTSKQFPMTYADWLAKN